MTDGKIDDPAIINERLVGEDFRRAFTGVSRSAWFELERRGEVPRRVAILPGRAGWRLGDLREWAKSRPEYTPPPAPRCAKKRAAQQRGGE